MQYRVGRLGALFVLVGHSPVKVRAGQHMHVVCQTRAARTSEFVGRQVNAGCCVAVIRAVHHSHMTMLRAVGSGNPQSQIIGF